MQTSDTCTCLVLGGCPKPSTPIVMTKNRVMLVNDCVRTPFTTSPSSLFILHILLAYAICRRSEGPFARLCTQSALCRNAGHRSKVRHMEGKNGSLDQYCSSIALSYICRANFILIIRPTLQLPGVPLNQIASVTVWKHVLQDNKPHSNLRNIHLQYLANGNGVS